MSIWQKRWPFFLSLSVMVNMLLFGFVLGGRLAERSAPREAVMVSAPVMRMVQSVVNAAPEAERAERRETFREAFRGSRPERRELRQARRRLAQAVLSVPYDAAAVDEALARLGERQALFDRTFHSSLAREIGRLDVEQRRALLRRDRGRAGAGPVASERAGPRANGGATPPRN